MSRTPLNRVDPNTASRVTPRKSEPANNYPSTNTLGNRNWPQSNYRGGYNNNYNRYPNQHGADRWPNNGPYWGHNHDHYPAYRYPYYHRYPYYNRYGCYQPYYTPWYAYGYPYFAPTFGFGIGFGYGYGYGSTYWGSYWGTPTYYAEPTVVYTEPSTVIYTQPAQTYYPDSGTVYIDQQQAAPPSADSGTTGYVAPQQYAAPSAPSAPPPAAAPSTASQPAQQQAPAKEPDKRVLAAVGQGNEHFSSGRFAEARKSYGEAAAIDPTDGVAKLLYGLAGFAEGDFASASTSVRQALDATPDLIWYPFNVKALYRNDAKFQEHVDALARQANLEPGNTEYQFLLGYMWYASGDAANAKTIFAGLALNHASDELFMALRDASSQALESLSKQPASSATTQPKP